tara:strand:+ start:596 stop:1039 length:444 start_codon:yes stop_codon:yes gene_type:complete
MASQRWAHSNNTKAKRRAFAYIAGSGFGNWEGSASQRSKHLSDFFFIICIYYNTSVQKAMGREIFTISVPIGSQVWRQLQAWREDEKSNVSANVCAAIQSDMDKVNRVLALEKRHQWLGDELKEKNPICGCRGLTLDQWRDFFDPSY